MSSFADVAGLPVHLIGFARAGDVWPALADTSVILHAGPPLLGRTPGAAMLGAMVGAVLFEGWAGTPEEARRLLDSGAFTLRSAHEAGGVGAMAGVVTPGIPVVVVERAGRRAFAPVTEPLGPAIRFGNLDAASIARLRELAETVVPALDRAVRASAPIDVIEMQADALRRGDDGHNRNVAATAMFATRLAPAIVRTSETVVAARALQELSDNAHFFLAISMAAAKAAADAVHEAAPPGIVTAMASNGAGTGIRVSGLPDWIVAPGVVELARGVDGHVPADFAPAMGDSPVTETIGLGATSLTTAPRLVHTLGLSMAQARGRVADIAQICVARHPRYENADLDFAPAALGLSVRRIVDTGIAPFFTTGFSHREFGRGRAGFGCVRIALSACAEAVERLGDRLLDTEPLVRMEAGR